ncbi:MAG: hypothetical protein QW582_03370, partial [Candidatus Micrarchaeaceae archaeon]
GNNNKILEVLAAARVWQRELHIGKYAKRYIALPIKQPRWHLWQRICFPYGRWNRQNFGMQTQIQLHNILKSKEQNRH